ncbi:acyclic terpene utilization AtuA family protein [Actinomadura montaniterrae]|uniref:Acyclic terpene utilization AtuA family protein n=1 Tax=Actinomadura montaniterrae TaxID=1803903 RepID=A0A6L3VK42_9ACTN|nr:acyclic terpene utilization AtuA family protein [Actinomadura montaniterrae]KAB2364901.1 acyclic terpene utilization AtuA family protein [Actinomadura montaniterrae]
MSRPLRIGNASGFYGDRFSAVREMLEGGPLDVLTGDYLAELTMLILGRSRLKDPGGGYASTFLRQMEESLGLAAERGVKIVTNAGGLNPRGLAERLRELAGRLGVDVRIAHVEGDDLLPRAGELGLADARYGDPLTANAYLGAWGIAECLRAGADVVVTGRVTDASLVVGPAAAHFGWARDDWDALAGATVAGHVLECGAQATGGNYAFFEEIYNVKPLGFPLAEVHADGSSVITKHPGTGGAVTVETVTAQLLYEIGAPAYAGPDVTTRFDTVRLAEDGPDRVRITGVEGSPPPATTKVCLNHLGGHRNEMTFVLTGLGIEVKAAFARAQLEAAFGDAPPARVEWTLIGGAASDPATQGEATSLLRCAVLDPDPEKVGRRFSGAVVELALAGYPGFTMTSPPGKGSPYGVYKPAFVPNGEVEHVAVLPDGGRVAIPAAETYGKQPPPAQGGDPTSSVQPPGQGAEVEPRSVDNPASPLAGEAAETAETGETVETGDTGKTVRVALGRVAGARSGDKGGDANIGVWARTDAQWRWLEPFLTVERLHVLMPETRDHRVRRYVLPNLRAVNFVVEGLLQEGVSASTRFDPQGKALGEWLRSRLADVPESLLGPPSRAEGPAADNTPNPEGVR